jgi:hypothetical protein
MLLARLFESLPLVCPHCRTDMRIIAFVTEAARVQRILAPIGEPPRPPPIAPAVDHPPGIPSRCRTGTSSPNRTPASSLTIPNPTAVPKSE